jgi:hypothetical protein
MSQTVMKRSGTVNGCKIERLGTFQPERSNAFERMVENIRVHVLKLKDQLKCLFIETLQIKLGLDLFFTRI